MSKLKETKEADKKIAIKEQVEYYLSDENLKNDQFFHNKISEDANGYLGLTAEITQYLSLAVVAVNSMSQRFISFEYNKGDYKESRIYYSSTFWVNVFFSIIFLVFGFFVSTNIGSVFNISSEYLRDVKIMVFLGIINVVIACLCSVFSSVFFVLERMDMNSYGLIIKSLTYSVGIFSIFNMLKPRLFFSELIMLISSSFYLIYCIVFMKKSEMGYRLKWCLFSLKHIIKMLKAGVWVFISDVSGIMLNGADIVLANLFISQRAMSDLTISKNIPNAIGIILGFLSGSFTASFTKALSRGNNSDLKLKLIYSLKILGFIFSVPIAGVVVEGMDFFSLWLNKSDYTHSELLIIYYLMMLTLINVIINAFIYSIHSLLIALKKVKFYSIGVLLSGAISLIITIFLLNYTDLGCYAIAGTSTVVLFVFNMFVLPIYVENLLDFKRFDITRCLIRSYISLGIVIILSVVINMIGHEEGIIAFLVHSFLIVIIGYPVSFFLIFDKESRNKMIDYVACKFFGGEKDEK